MAASRCWKTVLHGSHIYTHFVSVSPDCFFQGCLYSKQTALENGGTVIQISLVIQSTVCIHVIWPQVTLSEGGI